MEMINENLGKKVISIEDGKYLGYILDVCVDVYDFSVYGYLICDEETENVNFINLKDIANIDNYVMVENSSKISFGENIISNNPIGKCVITDEGYDIGRVINIEINKNKIRKIITNKCEIFFSYLNIEGDIIIFSNRKKKKKIINKKFNNLEISNTQKIFIQKKEEIATPYKTSLIPNKLIGKTCLCDIFGQNQEIIAKKNQIINDKIIKIAKKHNKLNILAFNSK